MSGRGSPVSEASFRPFRAGPKFRDSESAVDTVRRRAATAVSAHCIAPVHAAAAGIARLTPVDLATAFTDLEFDGFGRDDTSGG